jgi:hypothetical protein
MTDEALAAAAAELDIQSVEDADELALLAFSRIADGQSRGLFGTDTLEEMESGARSDCR